MSLSLAIVGLPNVGKSTLFNALTDGNALAANYPFATIEPNIGIVAVPDERLDKLASMYHAEKVVPATVTFVDVAGLVAGASKGEGLGNQFLSHIRGTQAIVHVVRAFVDSNVTQIQATNYVDPKADIDIINTELVLADLQTVDKRLSKFEKEARVNPKLAPQLETLQIVRAFLNDGIPLWTQPSINRKHVDDLFLITLKPIIYVFNIDDVSLANFEKQEQLKQIVAPSNALFICAKLEDELRGLDETDRAELLESYGQEESGLVQLIHAAYRILGLQSYLTAGDKEVRAWTIPKGTTAPQAAGVIHTDFEKGFIAAQVINYHDLLTAGSEVSAKVAGKVRTEGKDYVMQPDDVVEFRFNVSK